MYGQDIWKRIKLQHKFIIYDYKCTFYFSSFTSIQSVGRVGRYVSLSVVVLVALVVAMKRWYSLY